MRLTDPEFVRRLDSLHLLARKVLGGTLQADRKSTAKGSGVTFADYAEYYYGADYRAIDWRVFARFESLVIKLFELEEDATIYVLVDISRSMESKSLYARQLAAALGYISLNSLDRLAVYALGDTLTPLLDTCRGRSNAFAMLRALDEVETVPGDTRFNACCRVFQARHKRRGLVLVISDFLFADGFEEGIKYLGFHGHDVYALQVQDGNDTRCDFKGDADLVCVETDARRRVTVTDREARRYEQAVRDWNESLRRCCARRGVGLAATETDTPFERVVEDILRRGGLVA